MKNRRIIWIGTAVLLVMAVAYWHYSNQSAAVMTPEATANPSQVSMKLNVSPQIGEAIVKKIETSIRKPPAMSWTVPESNTKTAAKTVEKQIKRNEAPPMPAADKTIVTPRETKVDVYRITLEKPWEVGIGYGSHNGDDYIPVEIQRNYSRNKSIAVELHISTELNRATGYEIKHVWRF